MLRLFKSPGRRKAEKRLEEETKEIQRMRDDVLRRKKEEDVIRAEEIAHNALKQEEERKNEERLTEYNRQRGLIMDKTEQGASNHDHGLPVLGLVDLMEATPAGAGYLENTVISCEPPPDRALNIARLRTFIPRNDFARMNFSDIPPFVLQEEYTNFPITDAMTKEQFSQLRQFVHVSDVFIHYVPMDSFMSTTAVVNLQLNDFRKLDNSVMRMYKLTHAGSYNVLFTLDYCVEKKDLHNLTFSISSNLSSFRPGASWAAVKVILTLTHMDFPKKSNIQRTMGVLHLADSDLKSYITDPRYSDGVIDPTALSMIRDSYKRGEIENVVAPKSEKREVTIAQTVTGGVNQDQNVMDLMMEMRENALRKERAKNGVMKSALKKPESDSGKSLVPRVATSEDENDVTSDEIDPQESHSQVSEETEPTITLEKRKEKLPMGMRAVNWG